MKFMTPNLTFTFHGRKICDAEYANKSSGFKEWCRHNPLNIYVVELGRGESINIEEKIR